MVTKINAERFYELMNQEGKVVVKFGATWCGPCKFQTQQLENIGVEVFEIDVDEENELSIEQRVRNIPVVKIFQSGQLQRHHVGTFGYDEEAKGFVEEE